MDGLVEKVDEVPVDYGFYEADYGVRSPCEEHR